MTIGSGLPAKRAFELLALTLSLIICAPRADAQSAAKIAKEDRAPEVRFEADRVVLPITMVDEFPFVEGSVAGVRGKLMLDTGMEISLVVNAHRVPIGGGELLGTGFFGSGQTFETRLAPSVRDVVFGPVRIAQATRVQTQDARMLEAITSDFLGWIGYDAFRGYAMKLDYRRRRATFYRRGPSDFLAGERVIAVLPFEIRALPNHPIVPIRIGDVDAVAAFDTGQYGTLYASEAIRDRWTASGVLKPAADPSKGFTLDCFEAGGQMLPGVADLPVSSEKFPAARPIGLTEPVILSLGYGFLRRYKTVWDYPGRRLYLLAR